ncbi:YdcF family protein [Blautia sp. HCP3S3_G3]|uniref:YdcF family protein n=1 Tax=Blautia sp. HCP3S3_G3 TaxID=3438913 RepID=UPI003F8A1111
MDHKNNDITYRNIKEEYNGDFKDDSYEALLNHTEEFIFAEDRLQKADIIFVPGNGYPQMAEQAAVLYREGYAPYILPSGRFSIVTGAFSGVLAEQEKYNGNYETEFEFLKDVLMKNGVPKEAILKEDQSTFTYENAKFSRKVTDEAGLEIRSAILCCKSYHARRSLMYYQLSYPETQFYVCPSCPDGISRSNWRDTLEGRNAVTGEVSRIITQFPLML